MKTSFALGLITLGQIALADSTGLSFRNPYYLLSKESLAQFRDTKQAQEQLKTIDEKVAPAVANLSQVAITKGYNAFTERLSSQLVAGFTRARDLVKQGSAAFSDCKSLQASAEAFLDNFSRENFTPAVDGAPKAVGSMKSAEKPVTKLLKSQLLDQVKSTLGTYPSEALYGSFTDYHAQKHAKHWDKLPNKERYRLDFGANFVRDLTNDARNHAEGHYFVDRAPELKGLNRGQLLKLNTPVSATEKEIKFELDPTGMEALIPFAVNRAIENARKEVSSTCEAVSAAGRADLAGIQADRWLSGPPTLREKLAPGDALVNALATTGTVNAHEGIEQGQPVRAGLRTH